MNWQYGLTTVPSRIDTTLPVTLASLANAGFPTPRLFVDGPSDGYETYRAVGLPVTFRGDRIRTMGNWGLGLAELYYRDPHADMYAMFQDDLLAYRNLRQYLEWCRPSLPAQSYLNLYTIPMEEKNARQRRKQGWFKTGQYGKGALALIFTQDAVIKLLTYSSFVLKPQDPKKGHKSIDGAIVTAMNRTGYHEYCHYPTLVQHLGRESTLGHTFLQVPETWRGESYDALELCSGQ